MATETSTCTDKDKRDEDYSQMKRDGELHVVKFSTVEMIVNPMTGEIKLDKNGNPCYRSLWLIAYPSSSVPVMIRGRVRLDRRGRGRNRGKRKEA